MFRVLLLAYLGLVLVGMFGCNMLIFHPPSSKYQNGPHLLKIPVPGGYKVAAQYLESRDSALTFLYSHGNAENLTSARVAAERLRSLGFSVLIWDYGGYGLSGGKPTVAGTCQEIEAVYSYMVETLKIPADRIVLYGRSVGGGPTMSLAANKPVAGVVLESTFVSAFRVAIPFPLLPFDRFPNKDRIKQYQGPLLVMHGDQDEVVAFWHGKALFEAAVTEQKSKLWVAGAGHNNFASKAGFRYDSALSQFADTVLISQGKPPRAKPKKPKDQADDW